MFHYFKNKIFRQQFLIHFTMIVFTFTCISVVLLLFTRQSLESQQLVMADSYRHAAADTINNWLLEKEQMIKAQAIYLAQFNEAFDHSEQFKNLVQRQLILDPNLEDVFIIDNDGRVINSKDDFLKNKDLGRFPFFRAGIRGLSTITELFKGPDNVQFLMICTPIFRQRRTDSRPQHLLGVIVNLEHLGSIIDNLGFGNLGHAYLVDRQGQFLMRSIQMNDYLERYRAYQRTLLEKCYAVRQVMHKKTGNGIYRDFTGQIVLGSYTWLEPLQIGLVVEFSARQVLKPFIFFFRVILILAVLVIALGLVLAYLFSRRQTRHLNLLVEAASNIANNDYQAPLTLQTNSEIDLVVEQFNRMQIAIQAREKILEEKNLELKTQRAEALEATKMKSQFLANMSHELRTPLNSIIGFTARIIKKCGPILPPVQLENLEIVLGEARHLLELINDLLDFSKIEAGRMEVSIEPFNLVEVIREVNDIIQPLREGKSLEYLQELYQNDTIPLTSDRIKVKQILINLLSNAFKYSEKGTITLAVHRAEDCYRITVADQGIGIAPENLTRIFEEFRQVDGSFTRKVGGTGLGLSITQKFVTMLQGRIGVASVPGEGSTFTVMLPVAFATPAPPDEATAAVLPSNATKRKVVCIDDDPNVCRLYQQYLEEAGFEVTMWDGREDMVAKIAALQPEVILLDVMLPRKDGWEILAELKTHPETRPIPVIMASVLSERKLAYKLNAAEYLIKPVAQQELISTINRVVSGKNHLDILVADDDENYLKLIGQFLVETSDSIRFARDGVEALQMIAVQKPDLLLLDIMMPHKDGLTVLDEIRQNPAWNDLAVIMVTSKSLTRHETAVLADQTRQIIIKSGTHVEDIMAAIAALVQEKAGEKG